MAAFFGLSALFVRPGGVHEILAAQRFLLVAFFFWALLGFAVDLVRRDAVPTLTDAIELGGILGFANWSHIQGVLWFLPAVISLRVLISAYLSVSKAGQAALLAAAAVVVLAAPAIAAFHDDVPWGFDIALYMLPAALLCRAAFSWTFPGQTYAGLIVFIGAVALLAVLEPAASFNGYTHRVDFAQFNVLANPLNYGILCIALAALVSAFIGITGTMWLRVLGGFSLCIFLLHLHIARLAVAIAPFPQSTVLEGFYWVALVVGSCGAAVLIGMTLSAAIPTVARYLGLAAQAPLPQVDWLRARFGREGPSR
jgi:hypothetical protein